MTNKPLGLTLARDLVRVEQVDREAAASGYFAWISGNKVIPAKMVSGAVDDHSMVQAFAHHRNKATVELVEALRPFAEAAADLDEKRKDRDDLWESPEAMNITVGDLRRAAAVVKAWADMPFGWIPRG